LRDTPSPLGRSRHREPQAIFDRIPNDLSRTRRILQSPSSDVHVARRFCPVERGQNRPELPNVIGIQPLRRAVLIELSTPA
jgi:hypothetical protein